MKGSPYTIQGMAVIVTETTKKIASMTETHISNTNFGMRNYGGVGDRLRYSICAIKAISSTYYVGSDNPISAADVGVITSRII